MCQKDPCLGYIDTGTSTWRCEDSNLQVNVSSDYVRLSGFTRHFTNFGILLSPADSASPTDSYIMTGGSSKWWVYLVVVFIVVAAVAMGVSVYYVKKSRRVKSRNEVLHMLEVSTDNSRITHDTTRST